MLIIMNEENVIKVQADRGLGDLKGACISVITHLYLLTELQFLIFSLLLASDYDCFKLSESNLKELFFASSPSLPKPWVSSLEGSCMVSLKPVGFELSQTRVLLGACTISKC